MDCGGIPMTMRYSFEQDGDCDLRIHGSQGTLICRLFWKSDRYRIQSGDEEREYHFPFRSEFTFEAQQFIDRLSRVGVEATIRNSRGADIDAACGQLRQRMR